MHSKLIALALATNVLVPSLAHADWQYTKWGMTRDQLLQATPEKVDASSPWASPDKKTVWALNAPYQAAGVTFKANFGFDSESGRLVMVKLQPVDAGSCGGLKGSLLEKYGKPETEDEKKLQGNTMYEARWKDTSSGNTLRYLNMMVMRNIVCSIDYAPIGAANKNGL